MTRPPHEEPAAQSPQELREQVETTRHELGETVEALAARADVKARTQEKADHMKEQATDAVSQVKAKAAEVAHQVQDKVPAPVKDKAAQAAGQARATAAQAGRVWNDKAPEPVRQKAAASAQATWNNRTWLLAAAGVAVVWLACRRKS